MALSYPFSYGDKLTPEMAGLNRLNLFLFLTAFLLLAPKSAQAQFAHGFGNANIPWLQICRNYGIISRSVIGSNTVLQKNLNNNNNRGPNSIIEYISELGCRIDHRQLQRKFKHASDFNVLGNYNKENCLLFRDKIIAHMKNPNTKLIDGTFKGQEVTMYFNEGTRLNVILDIEGNFVSGWKLSKDQAINVRDRGAL